MIRLTHVSKTLTCDGENLTILHPNDVTVPCGPFAAVTGPSRSGKSTRLSLIAYSVSSFGSRNSAIGLATTRTLDSASPDHKWVDEGAVLRSYQDKDDWNAIDPNLAIEDGKNVWLTWGSCGEVGSCPPPFVAPQARATL